MNTTRLLFRWGVWMSYTEWRPDQPHEDWSGHLNTVGGVLRNPRQVIYHGTWAPQRRVFIDLPQPRWTSPRIDFDRPLYGYKGLEGLAVDVEGDEHTLMHFDTPMLQISFRLGDLPAGGKLAWHAGPKFSCSQLEVCRIEDEGVYWNEELSREFTARRGLARRELRLDAFGGNFLPRDLHHRIAAWVPPGGSVDVAFEHSPADRTIATWRFTGSFWASPIDTMAEMFSGCNSPHLAFRTALDGRELSRGRLKAKYMRGACSALEHNDDLGNLPAGPHTLTITNLSTDKAYLVLNSVTLMDAPDHWDAMKHCLPFQAPWLDDIGCENAGLSGAPLQARILPRDLAPGEVSNDLLADWPSGGRGIIFGFDTNVLAAENGHIDAAIRFLAATGAGNYILFRTECDTVSEADWRRMFTLCREHNIHFAMRPVDRPQLPASRLLELAAEIAGDLFIGQKNHELSLPLYSGWKETDYPSTRTLAEVERDYLQYLRDSYHKAGARRLLGEAALAHRYDYAAGVDLVLSETMTGNTSLLLAEARGAARAYNKPLWGMHIACHVHATPEGWATERMFWLNLYLGYLSGASIIEDEEGALAKVHSSVSGPPDPLPMRRQETMAAFFDWAQRHPRPERPAVEIGFLYGRHEMITGGMSLNTDRPVRVWDTFAPKGPAWEYGRPEYGWKLLDVFMPGVWLCPVLQDPSRLRRWFTGTPYGQADILPIEAGDEAMGSYKLLVMPGWHTMTADDMAKLIRFVEGGGTLVLGLPHLQTSSDRTAVLSGAARTLVDAALIDRLCGLAVAGEGEAIDSATTFGRTWDLRDEDGSPLRLGDVKLTTGKAASPGRSPLIVENSLGRGKVYTFTAWDYFGQAGLGLFARAFLEHLAAGFPFDIRLDGGDGEVSYFHYRHHDGSGSLYLINTDWTVPGNTKRCRLTLPGQSPSTVEITEGEVTEIDL